MTDDRAQYEHVKAEILAAIESIREKLPEVADYLLAHLEMDDERMTFRYTGDDRLRILPPWERADEPREENS